jgi:flagellin
VGLRIATNISSLVARRNLGYTSDRLQTHTEKIASGFRINKAADDAAGMAIASRMEADIRGMRQAQRNTVDGISLVQTAEGGLNEISSILTRLKELGVQAASDTIGATERGYLQKEFGALKDEIDRIASSTEFNGTRLLMGDPANMDQSLRQNSNPPPLDIQVGHTFIPSVDGPQVAKPVNTIRIDLRAINALTDGPGSLGLGNGDNENQARVDSKDSAQMTLRRVDDALGKVNEYRASLGAIQNRLSSANNATAIQVENISAARSRIKDADFAEEMAAVVQNRILQQSGVAVLAQANDIPQMALKLLNG